MVITISQNLACCRWKFDAQWTFLVLVAWDPKGATFDDARQQCGQLLHNANFALLPFKMGRWLDMRLTQADLLAQGEEPTAPCKVGRAGRQWGLGSQAHCWDAIYYWALLEYVCIAKRQSWACLLPLCPGYLCARSCPGPARSCPGPARPDGRGIEVLTDPTCAPCLLLRSIMICITSLRAVTCSSGCGRCLCR